MLYIHSIEKLIDNLPFVWYDLLYKSYHILLFPSIEKNIFLSVFSDFSIENL